jgi:hypothetical protein
MNKLQKINIDLKRIFESLPLSEKKPKSYLQQENTNFGTSDFKLESDSQPSSYYISTEESAWLDSLTPQISSSSTSFRTFRYWILKIYNHPAKYFKIWVGKFLIIYLEVFLFLFPIVGILLFRVSKRSLLETIFGLVSIELLLYIAYLSIKTNYKSLNIQQETITNNSSKYLDCLLKIYHLELFDDRKSYRCAKQILEVEKNEIESSEKKTLEKSVINGFLYSAFVVIFLRLFNYIESLAGLLGGVTQVTDQNSLRTTVISLLFASIFFIYKYRSITLQEKKLNQIKYCLSLIEEVMKLKDDNKSEQANIIETELQ